MIGRGVAESFPMPQRLQKSCPFGSLFAPTDFMKASPRIFALQENLKLWPMGMNMNWMRVSRHC